MTADVNANSYPPYNIEKSGDDSYRISIAVVGFSEDESSIEMRDGQLVVSAKKAETETDDGDDVTYLHRGIAARAFEKRFQMADHVRPISAEARDGLLHVDLVREIPEELKPRRIEIASPKKVIEGKASKTKAA